MDIITKFDRIEDILGSPDGRYFGNGYTQVKYFQKVKHITFEGIESVFEINYPKSWSTKKNLEELKQIIIPISNAGVDIFDCSEINYTDSAVTGKSGNLSYWVKKITNKPTITTGGIGSPEILYKDIPTLITEITSQPKMSYLHLQRKKAQIFYSNNLVSDFKEGGFDLLAFGRPLLINENWFDEITEEA